MKKIFLLLCCVLMCLSLCGCEQVTKKPEGEIAYIGYYNNDDGPGYLEAITRALEDYTVSASKQYTAYQLRDVKRDTFINTIDLAIKTGANTFVIPYDFFAVLLEVHANYPDCKFIVLDTYIDETVLGDVKNVYSASFNPYETGYIAGYMLANEDYDSFGYASNFSNKVEERYISGILQGLEDACETIEVVEVANNKEKISKKAVNFYVYDFENVKFEDIQTDVALAFQTKVDVFFYLGNALYEVIEDYTYRSGFEYVAYVANDRASENDVITIRIDYSSLLKTALNYLDKTNNAETNMMFGIYDGVQSIDYDMNYLKLSSERLYMGFRDRISTNDLVLLDDDSITWDKLKLKNVKVEKVSN